MTNDTAFSCYPVPMMLPRLLLLGAIVLGACSAAPVTPAPAAGTGATIYLVSHAWHTGIVVRRADVPPGLWPESRDFPRAQYLEIGWGDREFYQAPDPSLWTALRAALLPTSSVLQVVGFSAPVREYFSASDVIEVGLPRDGFMRLVHYIHDAHERGGSSPAAPLGPSLYGEGRFYPARETFHLFRTCNVWTARALRAAGLPVHDSITSEGLISQAREIGKVVDRPAR